MQHAQFEEEPEMWPEEPVWWNPTAGWLLNEWLENFRRPFGQSCALLFTSVIKPLRFTGRTQGVGSSFN